MYDDLVWFVVYVYWVFVSGEVCEGLDVLLVEGPGGGVRDDGPAHNGWETRENLDSRIMAWGLERMTRL